MRQNRRYVEKCGIAPQGCGKIPHAGASLDPVEVQFVVKGLAVDAEQFGGLRLVSPGHGQGAAYLLLLAGRVAQRHRSRTGNPGDFGRQFAAGDIIAPAEQRRRHHRVLHLPQVSRPVITHHGRSGFAVEPDDMLVQLAVGLVEEKIGIFASLRAYGA